MTMEVLRYGGFLVAFVSYEKFTCIGKSVADYKRASTGMGSGHGYGSLEDTLRETERDGHGVLSLLTGNITWKGSGLPDLPQLRATHEDQKKRIASLPSARQMNGFIRGHA